MLTYTLSDKKSFPDLGSRASAYLKKSANPINAYKSFVTIMGKLLASTVKYAFAGID
jgi:hypothetical protein